MNLEAMFEQFEQCATTSRKHLEAMLAAISEGRIPAQFDREQAEQCITMLQQAYDTICEKARVELLPEELPSDANASIAEYRAAWENSKTAELRKRVEEAHKCLQKFLAVHSETETYAKALEGYQEKAAATLQQLTSKKEAELDWNAVSEQLLAPQTFLQAMECENFDSEEGLQLYEKIGMQFSPRVQLGISQGKYILPMEMNTVFPVPISAVQDNIPTAKVDQTEKPAEQNSTLPFLQALVTNGVFVDEMAEFGEMQVDISPAENKKISASIFGRDFRSGPTSAKMLISAIQDSGCVNAQYLEAARHMRYDVASFTLDQWFKNGYLRRYSVTPGGHFYCTSPKLCKALSYRDASKLAGVQQLKEEDWGESIEDRVDSVAARVALVQLCTMCYSHQNKKTPISKKMYTVANSMFLGWLMVKSAAPHTIAMIGMFSMEPNNSDDIYRRTVEQAQEICGNGTRCWLFAGQHPANAKALADCVFQELPDSESEMSCYLYSLSQNAYYHYPTMEEVTEEKLQIMPEVEKPDNSVTDAEKPDGSEGMEEKPDDSEGMEEKSDDSEGMEEKPDDSKPTAEKVTGDEQKKDQHGKLPVEPDRYLTAMDDIYTMLLERRWYAAAAMLKTYCEDGEEAALRYQQLAYALQDPMAHCYYSADNGFKLIGTQLPYENTLLLATALRLFFSNQVQYDYIKPFYDALKDLKPIDRLPVLGNILYTLMDFKVTQQTGMDAYAGYRTRSQAEVEEELQRLRQEANDFYNNFVMGHKKERCSQRRFLLTKKEIFSTNSDMGQCLRAVADGDYDFYGVTKDFLEQNFFESGVHVSAESISSSRLWDYIQQAWENAGKQMQYRKNNMPLMSRLRSNIVNETTKVVQLLAKWCMMVELRNYRGEDVGSQAYRKVQRPLLEQIAAARKELAAVVKLDTEPVELRAGLQVIDFALEEIASYMDGSFQEDSRTYFYMPFLLTDDVLLGEDWMPDLDMYDATLANLQPNHRILEHVRKMRERTPNGYERLKEMLDGQCDN